MGDRGEDWVEKGEKKLKSFSLFSGGQKFEEAADYFAKGANQFKVQKNGIKQEVHTAKQQNVF